ncbi:c-type cytochrome biogenesis protein CcmI [Bradyrhizobium diazoefficiens]|nr:cytochrome C biogenesis protein [Bradyrhizobium diazoefficiens]KGJ68667.1 putative cytochrome C-type biogenesis protein [Bradyrhizobium diazoefficiens SEMIA 5080]BAR60327.1 cytochrome C-type biogenesis protein [Bradyrhizobium diazoefficiens]BBZ93723.1 cytochrome c-type biogenesis protein CycH [Bradyrhizobium diazoefficiens]BCA02721.1 cytochrome c-type biogenesis protein CycH [Bradyrhizobium diazoefficiens]
MGAGGALPEACQMTLWFVFALMTVAAIFAVLWPLGRSARAQNQGSEVVVYKDQLTEIERDLASGLIAAPEAEAARVEISRRLLAAAGSEPVSEPKSSLKWRRAAAVLALVGLPLVAIGVYMPLGSPRLQDFPLAQRERGSGSGMAGSLENLVVQVEQHLEKNPTDGRGWNVLAPVLERLGRFDDAVRAYRNSITYNGESPERRSDLGEAISAAAGGVVTAEAKTEFERAHALNADDPKANYFLGLAAEQDGRKDDAATIWRALLAKAPADAPWRPLVQSSLVRVGGGTMPALSDETIAASKDMSEGDRGAMVRGMVERLATRLKQNSDDVEGWLRLVRAYLVMGDRDKAVGASSDARQAVAKDTERLRQLNEGLKTLGLDG